MNKTSNIYFLFLLYIEHELKSNETQKNINLQRQLISYTRKHKMSHVRQCFKISLVTKAGCLQKLVRKIAITVMTIHINTITASVLINIKIPKHQHIFCCNILSFELDSETYVHYF